MTTNYSRLRSAGVLSGTVKNAKAKRRHREDLARDRGRPGGYVSIPLGVVDGRAVDLLARAARPRVQRWISAEAENKPRAPGVDAQPWGIDEIYAGRYRGRCRYLKIDYSPRVAAYGYTTHTRLVATIWATRYRYRAPRGWVYGRDVLGIYLARAGETPARYRYHLTSDDVRGGVAAMRAAGIRHEAAQRSAQRDATIARRLVAENVAKLRRVEVWVSLDDSRKAGNCAAGTISWCNRHGLDSARRYYPARVIERLAATHPSVERVIDAAKRRTLGDMDRGFCRI